MKQMYRIMRIGLLSLGLAATVHAAEDVPFTIGAGIAGSLGTRDGKAIYEHLCQACHMADGKGATGAGAYPALAGNPRLVARAYPAYVVVAGLAAMPAFGPFLDDDQVAAVVNYVRGSFGNTAPDALPAAEVTALRASGTKQAGANLKGR
jgi:mono/diheme cytochrome c family protein